MTLPYKDGGAANPSTATSVARIERDDDENFMIIDKMGWETKLDDPTLYFFNGKVNKK